MAVKHEIIQGDSYSYDITCAEVPTFDVNWTGKWAIVDKLGADGTIFSEGLLAISGDSSALEMRIKPAESAIVDPGKYYLVVEVTNTVLEFNQEIMQDALTIKKQGV